MTEHHIGERFEVCKIIYEVREGGFSCEGCSLYIKDENVCTGEYKTEFEGCGSANRTDHRNVIFVQIGESE